MDTKGLGLELLKQHLVLSVGGLNYSPNPPSNQAKAQSKADQFRIRLKAPLAEDVLLVLLNRMPGPEQGPRNVHRTQPLTNQ